MIGIDHATVGRPGPFQPMPGWKLSSGPLFRPFIVTLTMVGSLPTHRLFHLDELVFKVDPAAV